MLASATLAASDQDEAAFRVFPSSIEWTTEVSSGAITPPVVAAGHVIVALQSGDVSATRIADHKDGWKVRLAATTPLAAADGLVVVPVKGAVHALNASTGGVKWSKNIDVLGVPPVVRGGWVVLASGEVLTALRAEDGAEVWSKTIAPIAQRSAIDGDRLYLPLVDGRMMALELTSGKVLWEQNVGLNQTEPLVYGDRVYFGANGKEFVCLDTANGRQAWRFLVGAAIVGLAAADDARIYTVSMDNLLRAYRRSTGNLVWTPLDIGYRPIGGPILTGTQVAVPGRTATITAFDVETHKPTGKLVLPIQASTTAAVIPPVPGQPGRLTVIANEIGKPWLLVLVAEAPPAPPGLPLAPISELPGTSLPIPKLPS